MLYQRGLQLVRLHVGASYEGKLREFHKKHFVFTHWILPFPNTQRFWRSSGGRKEFIAVRHRLDRRVRDGSGRVGWEELQARNEQYEREEQRRTKRPVGWMAGWHLASSAHGWFERQPLLETPYEPAEIAAHLYGPWTEFERRLEAQFENEEGGE